MPEASQNLLDGLRRTRLFGLLLFYALFLGFSLLTRLALVFEAAGQVSWNASLLGAFVTGAFFDACAASFFVIPWALYLFLAPQRWFRTRLQRGLCHLFFFVFCYLMLFDTVAEWLFWEEFGVRFNFIAVDYLVYTQEVLRNINESYPVVWIFVGLFVLAAVIYASLLRMKWLWGWLQSEGSFRFRLPWGLASLAVPVAIGFGVHQTDLPVFRNNFNREIGKDGVYSLFTAFWKNELNFDRFYPTIPQKEAFARLRQELETAHSQFVSNNPRDITRWITHSGPDHRWNVIQITVESLSGEFLGAWGNPNHLTPNLDRLAREGLFFRRLYATGTRTVRGMEALSLSVPPTPGRSIIKRPGNEGLFNIGTVFRQRGYDTVFLYSGHGYFDNMNYFFGHNGFRIVDEMRVSSDDVTFANAWGACDEDLFRWVIREADRAYAKHQPFYHFVMTTSNHRPYTYPDDKVTIPSGTGRAGAVMYTDYAIGELIHEARRKPWFTNTVFAIIADHCASSAGRTELPVKRYEIPLILYAPALIQPREVDSVCSQMDFAPTLFGLLNWSYDSQFYGKDVLAMKPREQRAFIGNYQKLGFLTTNQLEVLRPVKQDDTFSCNLVTGTEIRHPRETELFRKTVALYETASIRFHSGQMRERPRAAPFLRTSRKKNAASLSQH